MPRPTNVFMKVIGWFFYWLSWCVVQFLARVYWRGDLRGFENVPKSGPFLVCPVHRSNADGPLVVILTRQRLRYLSKDAMFKIGWLGNIYRAMGAFPVYRGVPDREALKTCLEVLESGHPLVLFPEGTRKEGSHIEEIFEGAAYIALKANVPIIPVGIGNTAKASPRNKIFLRPVKIRMIVGEPIVLPQSESGRVPRSTITEGTELLRDRLQELFDQAEGRTPSSVAT